VIRKGGYEYDRLGLLWHRRLPTMITTTSADLLRHFQRYLDAVEIQGEEVAIVQGGREIARLVPGPARQTALEAMADLYRTLPEDAARGWLEDSRGNEVGGLDELRDPWAI
jgi:antitoxin (DNA-binding transcriptional repressor) of toxin-antitoxin stability system